MKFLYHDKANEAGVYKITNLFNGRIYIGSSSRFKQRAKNHYNDLLMNRHMNTFLQSDFNKCGKEHFIFEIIECVEKADKAVRLAREQYFINQFYDNGKNCYNFRKDVLNTREGKGNTLATNRDTDKRCLSPSEELRAKRNEATKAAYTPELKALMSEKLKERWKIAVSNNIITVINKNTNETVQITGVVRDWCVERELNYKAFNNLIKGKSKSCGGWILAAT